jgi:hypothetical protein
MEKWVFWKKWSRFCTRMRRRTWRWTRTAWWLFVWTAYITPLTFASGNCFAPKKSPSPSSNDWSLSHTHTLIIITLFWVSLPFQKFNLALFCT